MKKNTILLLMSGAFLFNSAVVYAADQIVLPKAVQQQQVNKSIHQNIAGKNVAKLLKADLVPISVGFNNEFCFDTCSKASVKDLGAARIKDGCHFNVIIKNIGDKKSVNSHMVLSYQSLDGLVKIDAPVPNVKKGKTTQIGIRVPDGLKRFVKTGPSQAFSVKADTTNTNDELNERNNTFSENVSKFM